MDISLYLAQPWGQPKAENTAWLLCPFENGFLLPEKCDGIFVFTDSTPYNGQSPETLFGDRLDILQGRPLLVLDFQRKDPRLKAWVSALEQLLKCPAAAPPEYLGHGPVFLPPIPPDTLPQAAVEKWKGREIVLDLSPLPTKLTLTKTGCLATAAGITAGRYFEDEDLLCAYRLDTLSKEKAEFTLWRRKEQLLEMAQRLGVQTCIALRQEWDGEVLFPHKAT